MSKLEIDISQTSKNLTIGERQPIISIINGSEQIINDISPSSNSVKERLETIKKENPPKFKFEWKPIEKYKSLFPNLKKAGKKELSKMFFYFWIRDDGKLLWSAIATGNDCEVRDVIPKSRGANLIQTIEITCKDFNFK